LTVFVKFVSVLGRLNMAVHGELGLLPFIGDISRLSETELSIIVARFKLVLLPRKPKGNPKFLRAERRRSINAATIIVQALHASGKTLKHKICKNEEFW
jgi:hypothetical protein